MVELIIGEASLGEVEEADVVRDSPGEGLDEARFPRARWSVEKITPSIRYPCARSICAYIR